MSMGYVTMSFKLWANLFFHNENLELVNLSRTAMDNLGEDIIAVRTHSWLEVGQFRVCGSF